MNDPKVTPAKPPRRWLRFGLRGLLGMILVIALLLAWPAGDVLQSRYEKATARQIEEAGGAVTWNDPLRPNPFRSPDPEPTTYQRAMGSIFGRDVLARIKRIYLPNAEHDSILSRLPKLERLRFLSLKGGSLSDASIDAVSRLESLTALVLDDTQIESSQMERLAQLPRLDDLEISACSVTKSNLAALADFPKLVTLCISFRSISGDFSNSPLETDEAVLESLANLKQVTSLELIDFPINDAALQAIGQMSSLKWLTIQGDALVDGHAITLEGVSALAQLTRLESLYLYQVPLDDDHLQPIGRLTNLESFHCHDSLITDTGLTHLNQLPKLASLKIRRCHASPEMIREIKTTHPGIQLDVKTASTTIRSTDGSLELEFIHEQTLIERPKNESSPIGVEPGGVF
ncbi:leucine-rich repeat domain-containing protein [Blastopirellula marina]|uniref:Leucine Rich repeats (2 copies) n=1 Tax=Blastopirellula marina TaxID=124 RepID=A0A2S8GPC8_9BACT|nr:hypothetical protein [Blastopirellula marina]PQO46277.1 hypothetical protein C5Y93_09835 [Blastopirellula marina]